MKPKTPVTVAEEMGQTNFTECKLSFCLEQNVCDCHNMKINFWSDTKNLNQPILGPVKGQGIRRTWYEKSSLACIVVWKMFPNKFIDIQNSQKTIWTAIQS